MNEYLLVFLATLLFFNLPKIFGFVIKGIGLKKIELTFEKNEKNEKLLIESNLNNKNLSKSKMITKTRRS